MRSEKQIAASRANGARSRGPKTPEGKARSARNAVRHGLLADTVVFENEDTSQFQDLVEGYDDYFQPRNKVEADLIDELCGASWRMRRAWVMENRFFHESLANQSDPGPADRVTHAFADLAETPKLSLLHRYETRLHMMYQRAFKNLLTLRKQSPTPQPPETSPLPGSQRLSASASGSLPPAPIPNARPCPTRQPKNLDPAIPNEPKNPLPLNKSPQPEPKPKAEPKPSQPQRLRVSASKLTPPPPPNLQSAEFQTQKPVVFYDNEVL